VKKYITIKKAAKLLHVTPLTLRNWDKAGKLRAYRHPINNYRVYRLEQIEAFLNKLDNSFRRSPARKIDSI
jgi:excisionase family DNA binding protein